MDAQHFPAGGHPARAVGLQEPVIPQLRNINTFHSASSGGATGPASRLGGLLSKGHCAASPASQGSWGSQEHCQVDPMLLLIGKLRPRMGQDLPKVTGELRVESKPLILSQAWVLMDSQASLQQETQLRQRKAGSPAVGAPLSGHRIVPTDMSWWTSLNIQCVCTEAPVSPLASACLDLSLYLFMWHLPPRSLCALCSQEPLPLFCRISPRQRELSGTLSARVTENLPHQAKHDQGAG